MKINVEIFDALVFQKILPYKLVFYLLTHEIITIRNLDRNPGILPLKLGVAKVQEESHKIVYFYDLNPVIGEINKLKLKSQNVTRIILKNPDYSEDISNYLKIL